MSKKSPLLVVKEQFGSKAELAAKVLPLLTAPEGEDAESFKRRIATASNKQLLRLWNAQQRLTTEFGSKEELAGRAAEAKLGWRNPEYIAKIAKFSTARLLDLHDQAARK